MCDTWSCKARSRWSTGNPGNPWSILVCACTNPCVGVSQALFLSFTIITFEPGFCKMCHEDFFLSRQAGKLILQHICPLSPVFMRLREVSQMLARKQCTTVKTSMLLFAKIWRILHWVEPVWNYNDYTSLNPHYSLKVKWKETSPCSLLNYSYSLKPLNFPPSASTSVA